MFEVCKGLWTCVCVYGCLHVPANAHGCHHGSQHMELTSWPQLDRGVNFLIYIFSLIHTFSCICVYTSISSHLEKDGNNF